VADGPAGLVAVGAALVTASPSAAQLGAIWASTDGSTWSRVDRGDRALGAGDGQVQVEHVHALGPEWVAAGVRTVSGRARVVVWTWGPGIPLRATALSPAVPAGAALVVTDLAVTPSDVVVAAVAAGRPVLWIAPVGPDRGPGHWRPVDAPPLAPPAGLRAALVAAGPGSALLVLRGLGGSQLWRAPLG